MNFSVTEKQSTVVTQKLCFNLSDVYLKNIISFTHPSYPILPQNALRRDFNGKCIELIEGHYLEVVVEV